MVSFSSFLSVLPVHTEQTCDLSPHCLSSARHKMLAQRRRLIQGLFIIPPSLTCLSSYSLSLSLTSLQGHPLSVLPPDCAVSFSLIPLFPDWFWSDEFGALLSAQTQWLVSNRLCPVCPVQNSKASSFSGFSHPRHARSHISDSCQQTLPLSPHPKQQVFMHPSSLWALHWPTLMLNVSDLLSICLCSNSL